MKIKIRGVVYDTSNVIDAPLNLLVQLHQETGMEGQDIIDGLASAAVTAGEGKAPTARELMAYGGLIWLGKRIAGEQVGFEEASAGLSLPEILEGIMTEGEQGDASPGQAPDPTPPGSAPVTAVAAPELPTPMLEPVTPAPSPSPGLGSLPPSSSIDSLSSTSGQA